MAIWPTPWRRQNSDSASSSGAGLEPGRRQRAQGAAQLAHRRGGLEAAPHDVADHDPERLARLEPERVVPVAPDLEALLRRAVGDPDLDALRFAERAREQAALQLERDLLLAPRACSSSCS